MRSFIAIDLDMHNEFFKSLQRKIDISFARLSFPKNFHLTLKFLGNKTEKELDIIIDKLTRIRFRPFHLATNTIGYFSNKGSIRVIWIGFEDIPELSNLYNQIADNTDLEDSFHPHVTLARVKSISDEKMLKKEIMSIKLVKENYYVDCFKLFKSTLTSIGPIYEELRSFNA
jgi:RNA 2',3'-cyclic 3'-phosphodiesterase